MSIKLPKLKRADFNKVKKKKILLLSDDLRLHSGVGTMSKEVVLNTCHKYDWVQVGGAIKHPDAGKRLDVSSDIHKWTGKENSVVIYPVSGYGDPNLIRHLIETEKPDAILHFTDPRFWGWLYQMEHEIRQQIPIMYYNIWDDLPFPHWNEPFYESCDLLAAISKQTYNINKHVCQITPRVEGKDLVYIPHGIEHKKFRPIEINDPEFTHLCNFRKDLFGDDDPEFVLFFNSRNIRRKNPSNLIMAYKMLCDTLPEEEAKGMCLLLHTDPVDPNGTDLPAVKAALCPDYKVAFTSKKYDERELNYIYNIANITCQPSSAEGFGLSICESLMAGTPIMATCIGGLQDQMGFKNDKGEYLTEKDFSETWPSNSDGRYKSHGEWAFPVWPHLTLQGSPQTPYIYDSIPSINDITKALKDAYSLGTIELERRGRLGRKFVESDDSRMTAKHMGDSFIVAIDNTLENFKPRKRFQLYDLREEKPKYPSGAILDTKKVI